MPFDTISAIFIIFNNFLSFVLLNSSLFFWKDLILFMFTLHSDNSMKNLTRNSCSDIISFIYIINIYNNGHYIISLCLTIPGHHGYPFNLIQTISPCLNVSSIFFIIYICDYYFFLIIILLYDIINILINCSLIFNKWKRRNN